MDTERRFGKVVTGRVLKPNLAQAERDLEYRFCTVMGVEQDPNHEDSWRVTWQEPTEAQHNTIMAVAEALKKR